jgi:hypothetical protein
VNARTIWLAALDDEDALQQFLDGIGNYRFFRYTGPLSAGSLDEAFAGPLREFFFAPTHVWLKGRFIDMADVPKVVADGRVVFATSPALADAPRSGPTAREARFAADVAATSGRRRDAISAIDTGSRAGRAMDESPHVQAESIVARLDVRKVQPGIYEYVASHSGQEYFPRPVSSPNRLSCCAQRSAVA